ncbi:hypothetical protein BC829DRAFT_407929 [Chytridium lagenaria]|nr:hypothetical protein BC829DRAFT_407929 [Chytridium lagenaria]
MSPPKTVLAPTAAMVESAVLEAAQSPNGSAEDRPRAQRLRFEGDLYTPGWVRHGGHLKEGLCELCPAPGRWLQLKNSAFW